MTHTALARKYRPTRFAELVAQSHVAAGLAGAVAKGRVAHGYLLTGPRGTGKTTAARVLAMALNCERSGEPAATPGEPCGECDSCRRIWSGAANLDVVEIDAASNRGVDDARELRERAMYAASGPDRYKVYIIDEAHMLTREAWNALLKILEEPPGRVVFVFATTEPQKIANTATPVLSRLQRFDFRRIGPRAIETRLQEVAAAESIEVEPDAAALIARVANGGMRDALSMFDQVLVFGDERVTAAGVREALGLIDDELYAELLAIVATRQTGAVFDYVARLVEQGADLVEFVNGAGEVLRSLMLHRLGGTPEGLTDTLRRAIDEVGTSLEPGDVLRLLRLLGETETTLRRTPNARLHVETLILQWTLLDRTIEIAEVLAALRGVNPSPQRDGGPGGSGPESPRGGAKGPPRSSGRTPRPAPSAEPTRGERDATPVTADAVREGWSEVLDAVGAERRMLREALADATVARVADGEVVLELGGDGVYSEGAVRGKPILERSLSTVFGQPLRVTFSASGADNPHGAESRRQTPEDDREVRMRAYRAQDPTLDAVADALDLELME